MLFFIPYGINALYQRRPIANWLIIAVTVVISCLAFFSMTPEGIEEPYANLVLDGWKLDGLLWHTLLHGDIMHLAGNMIFLWVFGNALCANMNNMLYVGVYILLSLLAATAHNIFDGNMAIGASGAVNGVIGLAFAVYPRDNVDVFYLFFIKGGSFEIPVWVLTLIWLAFDIWGALGESASVAYFAHIGGLGAGILIGLLLLHFEKIDLTIHDQQTLLEFVKREKIE